MKHFKQLVLVILDGFGVASPHEGNLITEAGVQNIDYLINNFPSTTLQASGPSVGLPWGERGNSEVGHLNLGAGRIVSEDLPRITRSIVSGVFFKNPSFLEAIEHVKKNNSNLHVVGMVGQGGVHSSEEHLYSLLALAREKRVEKVFVHMFTDGRDSPPKSALASLDKLNKRIMESGVGKVATVTGRFYAMDRARHWELTEQTYRVMTAGEGERVSSAAEAIENSYKKQIFDETILPAVVLSEGKPVARVVDGDSVIFFNFRQDRASQLARSFADPGFDKFSKGREYLQNMYYTTMTLYDDNLAVSVAFPPQIIKNGLAEIISGLKLSQFHIAESEKYAHVTSFFSGGRQDPWPGEEREIVSSPESYQKRYEDVPEMSAEKISQRVVAKLKQGTNFILVNFANLDMVGHTGNKESGILAVGTIDRIVGVLFKVAMETGACIVITADHGNIEEVLNPRSGQMEKGHSSNPVPFIVAGRGLALKKVRIKGYAGLPSVVPEGVLSDVTPTVLDLMGLTPPKEITALSLMPLLLKQVESSPLND